ncbi:LysE family translocator [Bradyrhizobium prioriisuperbiae]|uniref:LysE family translocator n=1 Tax=Bradyrhizobium prioriisuperbiae TaxID=2854389 RepID=UPI0028E64126|nr:LysE family translocator [Bradyrhizobium prioritasuperba]
MFGIHDFWLFAAAGLLLNITPGPDTAYVVGRSLQLGWRGGVAAALGIGVGCLVHIAAAAVGLSAVLAASSAAFALIKLIGAVYLCYIGIRMVLTRANSGAAPVDAAPAANGLRQVFWQGALTNALNPKVALFFLAFLPQFVDMASPSKPLAFLVLGLLFNATGTVWNFGMAVAAARAAGRVKQSQRIMVWINRALGSLFIYLGARVAMLQQR